MDPSHSITVNHVLSPLSQYPILPSQAQYGTLNNTVNDELKNFCSDYNFVESEQLSNHHFAQKKAISLFNRSEKIQELRIQGKDLIKNELQTTSLEQLKSPIKSRNSKKKLRDILLSKGIALKSKNKVQRDSFPNTLQSFIMQRVFKKVKISLLVKAFVVRMIESLQRTKGQFFLSSNKLRNVLADKADAMVIVKNTEQLGASEKFNYNSYQSSNNGVIIDYIVTKFTHLKFKLYQLLLCIPVFEQVSQYRIIWDIIQLIALAFFFAFIPLSICFDYSNSGGLLLISILFIFLLTSDLLVNLNTSIFYQGKIINTRNEIQQHYIQNGMKKDCLSLFPLFVLIAANQIDIDYTYKLLFSFVYVFFYLRLEKFQLFQRKLEVRFHLSPKISQVINLWNLLFLNLYIIHFLACFWIVISNLEQKYSSSQTWLDVLNINQNNWTVKYLHAFYFNTVTMVTVGYGDLSPQTYVEKLLSICTVLSACGVFAYSISEVGSIFQEMQRNQKLIKNNMYIINNYMKQRRISNQLQHKIRHYLEYYWNESEFSASKRELEIVSQLSDNLRESLMIEANKVFILESPILKSNFSIGTLLRTISIAQEQKYTPEEIIFYAGDNESSIYFIERGSVEVLIEGCNNIQQKQNKNIQSILKQGQFFGEGSFFTGNPRKQTFRSVEFTTLLKIEREPFLAILKENQEDYEQFCLIKDNIIFNNISLYSRHCKLCSQTNIITGQHSENNCPYLHFVPSYSKLQYMFRQQIVNKEREKRSRKDFKFQSTLSNMDLVWKDQMNYEKNNQEYIEENFNDQIYNESFQMTQRKIRNQTMQSFSSSQESDEADDLLSIDHSIKNKSEESIPSLVNITKQRKVSLPSGKLISGKKISILQKKSIYKNFTMNQRKSFDVQVIDHESNLKYLCNFCQLNIQAKKFSQDSNHHKLKRCSDSRENYDYQKKQQQRKSQVLIKPSITLNNNLVKPEMHEEISQPDQFEQFDQQYLSLYDSQNQQPLIQNFPLFPPQQQQQQQNFLSPNDNSEYQDLKKQRSWNSKKANIFKSKKIPTTTTEDLEKLNQLDDFNVQLKKNNSRLSVISDNNKINNASLQADKSQYLSYYQEMLLLSKMDIFDKMKIFNIYFPHNNYDRVLANILQKKKEQGSSKKMIAQSQGKMTLKGNPSVKQAYQGQTQSVLENLSLKSFHKSQVPSTKKDINQRSKNQNLSDDSQKGMANKDDSKSQLSLQRSHRFIITQLNSLKRNQFKSTNKSSQKSSSEDDQKKKPLNLNRIQIQSPQIHNKKAIKSLFQRNNTVENFNYDSPLSVNIKNPTMTKIKFFNKF